MSQAHASSEPFERFRSIYHELNARRRWHEGPTPLRYAAVSLLTSPGAPYMVADRVYTMAETLKSLAGWFGPLRSAVRFVVAANLLSNGDDPRRFCADVARISEIFRQYGLRRGSAFEVLAILILRGMPGERRVGNAEVLRFQKIYEMMKTHHWWLTGPDDYAACALLSRTEDSVGEMARRIEILYRGLRAVSLPPGNPLQLASHVLYFNPATDHIVQGRFLALRERFRSSGVRIWQADYDEIAVLSFLEQPVDKIILTAHQASMIPVATTT